MPQYDDGTEVLASLPAQRGFRPGLRRGMGEMQGLDGYLGDTVDPTPLPAQTLNAPEDAFQTAQMARQTPSSDKGVTSELLQAVRRFNITAAPPAHIRPPIWQNPIDLSATVSVPGAVNTTNTVVVSYTVPKGYWARIEQYGVNVQDPSYTYNGSLLWSFVKNGALLGQGMSGWGEQRGSMVYPSKTTIVLQQGDLIQFDVQRAVLYGSAQTVQMCIRGWAWRLRNNYEGTQASVTAY